MKKVFCSIILFISIICVYAQPLTVASYNIRNDNDSDTKRGDGWKQRGPVLAELIIYNDFDIFGAQEVLHNQIEDLLEAMPGYAYIGVGRDDGKTLGEYSPIFYKKERINMLKSGHFWLSEKTDYPNKGWDAVLPRICTWGLFEDIETKHTFYFFNLHMDHIGVIARSESAKLVLAKIKEMSSDTPVILTGDFNVDQNNESYHVLNSSGVLRDTYDLAKVRYALNGTFNAWDANLKTDSRIDHIFVSKKFGVERYGILTDTYRSPKADSKTIKTGDFPKEVSFDEHIARLPSDHFPVKVILHFEN